MKVCTYTCGFERAEMNMLEVLFGKRKHVGCLFHWKQAIFKYLNEKCGLGNSISLEAVMKVGGLVILCVLPRCEVLKYAILFIRSIIEYDIPTRELEKWTICWKCFKRQWMPILASWNIQEDNQETIQMMNRMLWRVTIVNLTIFSKVPTLKEFVQLVGQETRNQAEKLDLIQSGIHHELVRDKIWVPDIPLEYHDFKVMLDEKEKEETTKTTNKTRKEKKRKKDKHDDVEVEVNQSPLAPWENIVESRIGYPKHTIKAPKRSI